MSPTKYEKAVVISDLHMPFQDAKAVNLVIKFIKDFKPDVLFLAGDIIDARELSKFTQVPDIGKRVREEFAEARLFLLQLRSILPKAKIVYIEGNHEKRFNRFIWEKASELWGIDGLNLADQLNCKQMNIEYVGSTNSETWTKYGHLYVGHFDKVAKDSGATAKALIGDRGVSCVQGHTHRLGSCFKTLLDRTIVGYENGCLCDLRPFYTNYPNWQLGFSVIFKKRGAERFHVYQIPIIDYKFFFGTKEFTIGR